MRFPKQSGVIRYNNCSSTVQLVRKKDLYKRTDVCKAYLLRYFTKHSFFLKKKKNLVSFPILETILTNEKREPNPIISRTGSLNRKDGSGLSAYERLFGRPSQQPQHPPPTPHVITGSQSLQRHVITGSQSLQRHVATGNAKQMLVGNKKSTPIFITKGGRRREKVW